MTDLYKNRSPDLAINSDGCSFLIQLAEAVGNISANWNPWVETLEKLEKQGESRIQKNITEVKKKFFSYAQKKKKVP
jgi:hypothetical protein